MDQPTTYYLPWSSLSMLETFALTPHSPSQLVSLESSRKANTQCLHPESLTGFAPSSKKPSMPKLQPSLKMSSSSVSSKVVDSTTTFHFNSPLPSPNLGPLKLAIEQRLFLYTSNLRLLPFPNYLHCLAKDKLCLWLPTSPSTRAAHSSSPNIIPESALNCILEVIGASWADSIKKLCTYMVLVY